MKLETLQKVEREIEAGKLGIASDRLHGLITTYPDDVDLRIRLGDVYWKLGYPVHAGRCWIFGSLDDPTKSRAIDRFLESCGRDPDKAFRRLNLKRASPELRQWAAERLRALLGAGPVEKLDLPEAPAPKLSSSLWAYGCAILTAILFALVLIGMGTVASWIFR